MSAPTARLPPLSPLHDIACSWHGPLSFKIADALNHADAASCVHGAPPRIRLFTPDAPVLTLGRRVHDVAAAGLSPTIAACRAANVAVLRVDRGGQATLHLPGQIVALVALPCERTSLATVVARLLDGAAAVAREHHLSPTRGQGRDAGLWLAGRKLASIGLRHQQGVARHGIALNVAIDATLSRALVLCGHQGLGYADLRDGGRTPDVNEVAAALIRAWGGRVQSADY